MKKHGARLLLVLGCVLAIGTVVQDFRFNSSTRLAEGDAQGAEREFGVVLTSLANLRAAQTAYLATGQGPEFWMRRASEIAAEMQTGIGRIRASVGSAQARVNLDSATTALTDLMNLDKRAREAIASDQRFLASDIIFAEGLTPTQSIVDNLATARDAEISAIQDRLLFDSRLRLAMTPVALLFVLAAAFTAGRAARPPAPSAAASMAQMIRDLPPPVKTPIGQAASATAAAAATTAAPKPTPAPVTVPATPVPATATAVVPAPVAPPKPPVPSVDWATAAELCVDLARVMDSRDMPALLERAAKTMDANGLVVWVINRQGTTLMPMLSHGYSDRVLAKLGTLDASADNVTSLSFRTMRPQSMTGLRDGKCSAVAVPLITADGCNGVLSAEVPGANPAAECVAMARIIAAQFSTIIAPVESTTTAAVQA